MATSDKIIEMKGKFDELEMEIGVEKSASYAQGFLDGKISMGETGTPSDKLYSQVEVDGMIAPLNEKIVGLESGLKLKEEELLGLKGEMELKVGEALKAKSELEEKIKSFIESGNMSEKALLDSITPVVVETPVEEKPMEEIPVEVPVETPVEPVPSEIPAEEPAPSV